MRKVFDAVMDFILTPWYKMQASKIDALTSSLEYYKDQLKKTMEQFKEGNKNRVELYEENCKLTQENKSIKMVNENLSGAANKYQLEYNSALEACHILEGKVKELETVNKNQSETLQKWTDDYKAKCDEVEDLKKKLEKKGHYKMMAKLAANRRTIDSLLCKLNKYETRKDTTTN